jgi:hypothetical protein
MSKYRDKKYVSFLIQEKEGHLEATQTEVTTIMPEVPIVLPEMDLEIEKHEKTDPRYEGLDEVYFQDTQGKLALVHNQVRAIGNFDPISRKSPGSMSIATCSVHRLKTPYKSLVENVFNGAYEDNPNRSRSHPGHYLEK